MKDGFKKSLYPCTIITGNFPMCKIGEKLASNTKQQETILIHLLKLLLLQTSGGSCFAADTLPVCCYLLYCSYCARQEICVLKS